MGTRGFVGFNAEGRETITYNHWDSYPEGLGVAVLHFLRTMDAEDEIRYRDAAIRIKHVSNDVPPTRDEIVELIKYSNLSVSEQDASDWYCLLRETHGKPRQILGCGYAEHAPEFPLDSLFCEWGYLIDFDARKLEVYQGFQTRPPTSGRWAGQTRPPRYEGDSGGYHAVELVATYDFDDLPTDEAFTARLEPSEEDA